MRPNLSEVVADLNLTDMDTYNKVNRTPGLPSLMHTCDRLGIESGLTASQVRSSAEIREAPIGAPGRPCVILTPAGRLNGATAPIHLPRARCVPSRRSRMSSTVLKIRPSADG